MPAAQIEQVARGSPILLWVDRSQEDSRHTRSRAQPSNRQGCMDRGSEQPATSPLKQRAPLGPRLMPVKSLAIDVHCRRANS